MSKTPHGKNTRHMRTEAAPEQQKPIKIWSLDTFFYAFIVLGVLVHWFGLNYQIMNGARSAHWLQTTGVVTDMHTREHSQSNVNMKPATRPAGSGTTSRFYEVVPTYEYTSEGKKYVNNKVTTNGGWFFGGEREAEKKTTSLGKRALVVVYYDPADPSSSVLEQGVADRTSSGMLVTIPAIGGATGMAFNYFSAFRIPERRKRLMLSIAAGAGLTVILALLQWMVLNTLI